MAADARDRTLRVADLIDRPGASRRVDVVVPPAPDLQLDLAAVEGDLHFDGVVESVVDGLLVRGALRSHLTLTCARCLVDLRQHVEVDVVELFTDPAAAEPDDDTDVGYEITDGTIDLDTLIRDALVPAVPYRPLCHEACQGLCAQCGTDRNEAECTCSDDTVDARWAALEGLRLRDGDTT